MGKNYLIKIAGKWHEKLFGLLNKKTCQNGELLMLTNCNSVHSFGMHEAIDIAFLDSAGTVLKAIPQFLPGRVASCRQASCVLERRQRFTPDDSWFIAGDKLSLSCFAKKDTIFNRNEA